MFHPFSIVRTVRRRLALKIDLARARQRESDISIFHEFAPPPAGGGHQFMRALWVELERRGFRVQGNSTSPTTRACLFNSFNFDAERLKAFRRPGCRMVHRVDGPIGVYRGFDDGTDARIATINREFADATIFQSHYSLQKHQELGLTFKSPAVIPNAPDPAIFSAAGRIPFDPSRKIRLISVSWSDNINKGAPVYQWLDENLDWSRFEYTFIGRSPVTFKHIRMIAPVASADLARELRQHDLYITASKNDPCSNSLLEALACGLPALYLNSGGHPEITGGAGLAFDTPETIPELLNNAIASYISLQASIQIPSISAIAGRYLEVMGLAEQNGQRKQ
ncbi:MAG: glycosyltransferase [bacterium]